jgi:hypothetical protein
LASPRTANLEVKLSIEKDSQDSELSTGTGFFPLKQGEESGTADALAPKLFHQIRFSDS